MPTFFFIQVTFSFPTHSQSTLDSALRLMEKVSLLLLHPILDKKEKRHRYRSLLFLHPSSQLAQGSVVRAIMEQAVEF